MNRLPAQIIAVDVQGSIALVTADVDGRELAAMLIGGADMTSWRPGMPVTLLFQEAEVALAKSLSGLLSLRNRMPAIVSAIEHGKLLTKVALVVGAHRIESIITTRSSHMLGLAVGDAVEALVKATDMTVMPGDDATPSAA